VNKVTRLFDPGKGQVSDRYALIARKQEVRRQIERLRRQLEQLRSQQPPVPARRIEKMETELEQLMAEEYNLRMRIDRSAT
jgi:hypothetical protein